MMMVMMIMIVIIIIIIIIIIRKLIDISVACNRVCELRVEQVKKHRIFYVIRRFIKLSTLARSEPDKFNTHAHSLFL